MADQNNQDSSHILGQVSSIASYVAVLVVIWFWTYTYEIENDRRTMTQDLQHAETGPDMLKRSAHKNLKKSNADPLIIDEVDEMIYMNAASLENIEEYEHGEQSEATDYAPTPNVYPESPTPIRNKKSKHEHLESMADMLRGAMDKLASAITGLSSALPISESEIWNTLGEMNLESRVNTKAYIFLCQNASACRTLIGCPKEARKALLLEMVREDN